MNKDRIRLDIVCRHSLVCPRVSRNSSGLRRRGVEGRRPDVAKCNSRQRWSSCDKLCSSKREVTRNPFDRLLTHAKPPLYIRNRQETSVRENTIGSGERARFATTVSSETFAKHRTLSEDKFLLATDAGTDAPIHAIGKPLTKID